MTSLRDAAENATAGVPVVRQQAAVAAFRQVLADVEHKEQTNTRNPGTDYRARQFFVEHGPDYASALDTARAEIERLRDYAVSISEAIREAGPLSGSEAVKLVSSMYFADPEFYARRISELRVAAHNGKAATVRERKTQSALTAAQARIAEVEGALKPFAKWPGYRPNSPDSTKVWTVTIHSKEQDGLTMGDFGRARTTLSPAVKEPK